jgi:hypothetical protein
VPYYYVLSSNDSPPASYCFFFYGQTEHLSELVRNHVVISLVIKVVNDSARNSKVSHKSTGIIRSWSLGCRQGSDASSSNNRIPVIVFASPHFGYLRSQRKQKPNSKTL